LLVDYLAPYKCYNNIDGYLDENKCPT